MTKLMNIKGVKLEDFLVRRFTKELEGRNDLTVYDLFKWKKVHVKLVDHKTDKIIYEGKDLEFPEQYSQNACDIIASKYFKRANVPNARGAEYSLKEVIHRMVRFWTEAGIDEGVLTNKTGEIFYDEMAYAMLAQFVAPNSPQWFNTGLNYYDTSESSDGHYYYDTKGKRVKQSKDKYSRAQASACFILSVEDRLLGKKSISEQCVTETRLFKHGSGTGTNFSNLRAQGERLSGGGTSSGVMSFLKPLDSNAGAIKSGGTTRRSAKMVCLDVDHPEIMEFMTWKAREEEKVKALGKMGYDTEMGGEAYETVSGQNSNNSVRFSNSFMGKVESYVEDGVDSEFELKGRKDNSVNKKMEVSKLWDTFIQSAWNCADPAPHFDDTFNEWHTCPSGEDGEYNAKHNRINSTNPCSEYAFLDDTACNLASINAKRFYNPETGAFDIEAYKHVILFTQLALEFTIHWGQFPVEEVARKTHVFRTTGLGIANTASVHLLMGHAYDSDEARAVASGLVSILTGYAYFTSSLLAKKVGAFEAYKINKPHMLEVIRNHARVSGAREDGYERLSYKPIEINHRLLNGLSLQDLSLAIKEIWNDTVTMGEEYGYRNAQVSVIAPTGTISFAMDCESTSIEPFFSHSIYKKLIGGGGMMIVNPLIPQVLKKLGYAENEIGAISEEIKEGRIEESLLIKPEHVAIFDTANKTGNGERYISPMGHVKMVASLTPLLSGAISKTVNLPKTATTEDISKICLDSWRMGIKGITVYRDGSKASQPLNVVNNNIVDEVNLDNISYKDLLDMVGKLQEMVKKPLRIKPTGIRPAKIHPAILGGVKLYITISYDDDGSIFEVYIKTDREGEVIPGLCDSLSKQMSKMLQYNIPISDIIKSLKGQKYEPHGFVIGHPYIKYADSISDLIARVLELEIGDYSSCQVKPTERIKRNLPPMGENLLQNSVAVSAKSSTIEINESGIKVYGKTCPNCNSTNMLKNGTCHVCADCGTTTGCS